MNSRSPSCALLCAFAVFPPFLLEAAIAPKSPEELERSAAIIAIGTVESTDVSVSGNPLQSRWNLDLVVRMESVQKGGEANGIKSGDSIEVILWSSRRMSAPGHQGMDIVPASGSKAKFWLRKNSDGVLEPIYPNGIELLAGDPRFDFAAFERQRAKGLALKIGIPILVVAALGVFLLMKLSRKKSEPGP